MDKTEGMNAQSGKQDGCLGKIFAVVVALLTAGTLPWWWPHPSPSPSEPLTQDFPFYVGQKETGAKCGDNGTCWLITGTVPGTIQNVKLLPELPPPFEHPDPCRFQDNAATCSGWGNGGNPLMVMRVTYVVVPKVPTATERIKQWKQTLKGILAGN